MCITPLVSLSLEVTGDLCFCLFVLSSFPLFPFPFFFVGGGGEKKGGPTLTVGACIALRGIAGQGQHLGMPGRGKLAAAMIRSGPMRLGNINDYTQPHYDCASWSGVGDGYFEKPGAAGKG